MHAPICPAAPDLIPRTCDLENVRMFFLFYKRLNDRWQLRRVLKADSLREVVFHPLDLVFGPVTPYGVTGEWNKADSHVCVLLCSN